MSPPDVLTIDPPTAPRTPQPSDLNNQSQSGVMACSSCPCSFTGRLSTSSYDTTHSSPAGSRTR